jgi:hypothetical protein
MISSQSCASVKEIVTSFVKKALEEVENKWIAGRLLLIGSSTIHAMRYHDWHGKFFLVGEFYTGNHYEHAL